MIAQITKPNYFNDPIAQRVVRLAAYMKPDRSDKPNIATGFFMKNGDDRFLVTNYHVFTGQSPERRFLGKNPMVPYVIEVWNFGVPVADIYPNSDYLVHPELRNIQCDIVVYPLSNSHTPEKGEPHGNGRLFNKRANMLMCIEPLNSHSNFENGVEQHRFVQDAFLPISRDATVFGYPGGVEFDYKPVGVNTKIASSVYGAAPFFFVSGTTYKGCSGGPVVARSLGGYLSLRCTCSEEHLRLCASSYKVFFDNESIPVIDQLIGVYSGRMKNIGGDADEHDGDSYVGQVWQWRLVLETLQNGVLDSAIV